MIDERIFRLTPKKFFCPICGKWHDWKGKTLQSHDDYNPYEYECCETKVALWIDYDFIHIESTDICDKVNSIIVDEVYIDEIEYDEEEPIIKFTIYLTTDEIICSSECEDCDCCNCNLPKIGDNRDDDDDEFVLPLEFKFEFQSRAFNKYVQMGHEEGEKQQEPEDVKQNQEEFKMQQNTETHVTEEFGNNQTNQAKKIKEESIMKNNILNMNMEFGPNDDENIVSTLMGIAVKNGDSWRIYDKNKKEITDVGDVQLGNLPIFILPTIKISEGDLIKDAGEYYFVTRVATAKTPTQTLSARTGELKSVVPIKNILGFSCYSKVIALGDSLNMGDDFDVEKMAIMSAMCGNTGENGGQMNQLLPLMLFKDKLGGDDDMMKLMLMSSMMTSGHDGGQMNQLLPLMLFKDNLGGDDDMMKLMLMSSMMGGDMAGSNNPMMSYLMLDTFMNKNNDKDSQAGNGTAKI